MIAQEKNALLNFRVRSRFEMYSSFFGLYFLDLVGKIMWIEFGDSS